ncbi:uncharacterized protein CDV56_100896 [Aspergillus thermomutatus]|uniref:Major facilitator superfamily (MFS) profile domain-containing protein n=1 Tax=Aspergillus thermomutatus TaxID=41047 RepID=A0A397G5F3_ASPTH|nr:uncharacterized protein CDV56_100896 [Aspergillus thermomutatus]RHZ46252.1 hypothetical protein CDV56_100896 [Aspergillus thermomutatus]
MTPPESFTVAPSAMVVGILTTRWGHYRWAMWLGWLLSMLSVGLISYIKVDTSIPACIFLNIVPGIGLGLLSPLLGFAIQASATSNTLPIAAGMFSFLRAMGQAIGVAIGGVVFQDRMYHNLLKYPSLTPIASEYSQDAAGLVQAIK